MSNALCHGGDGSTHIQNRIRRVYQVAISGAKANEARRVKLQKRVRWRIVTYEITDNRMKLEFSYDFFCFFLELQEVENWKENVL
jgi:hypothetical protein